MNSSLGSPVPGRDPVAVRCSDLTRTYGLDGPDRSRPVPAVRAVTLQMRAGELVAVMGPSGSGKTTLLHLLAGLDRPDAGVVEVGGTVLASLSDDDLTRLRRHRMGFVFQAFNLVSSLTALENIRLPLVFDHGPGARPADEEWETHLVAELGLGALLDRRPRQLSGGEQQRVAVARALLHRPAVVFADEPTGNLDLATGHHVLSLLGGLAGEGGSAVVLVTHDPVAASVAGRVLFMRDGLLVDEQPALPAATISEHMLALVGAR
jgi:putative ABC transport system ATP-binding protein